MSAAQVELAETAGPSTALASLRSGRDDNINSTNFRDRALAWSSYSSRLPQLDRISLRVMQAGETAVGIRLRINLDRDSCGSQLGCHLVEIADSKVQHPVFVGVPEIVAGFRKRADNGR